MKLFICTYTQSHGLWYLCAVVKGVRGNGVCLRLTVVIVTDACRWLMLCCTVVYRVIAYIIGKFCVLYKVLLMSTNWSKLGTHIYIGTYWVANHYITLHQHYIIT